MDLWMMLKPIVTALGVIFLSLSAPTILANSDGEIVLYFREN
jgi:hypothetical protein